MSLCVCVREREREPGRQQTRRALRVYYLVTRKDVRWRYKRYQRRPECKTRSDYKPAECVAE